MIKALAYLGLAVHVALLLGAVAWYGVHRRKNQCREDQA